ncbi:MAG: hypothetical protein H0W83_12990 [Planctomycetes bacterium]|nr:hypothetical protein [Planctomycetota bacterium]
MPTVLRLSAILVAAAACSWSAESTSLDPMDAVTFKCLNDKGTVEVADGKVGKALKFVFADDSKNAFMVASTVRGKPEWDQAAGISFWVKGDGSANCGALQFVWNEDYGQRYDCGFSIASTEWTKVVVPWRDLIPVLAKPECVPLDPKGDHQPSKLGQAWFGKWWYWNGAYGPHSYTVDDIRLEPTIDLDTKDYKPSSAPLARVYAKMKAGKPITVVTMGDSLTDTHHWSNQQTNWPAYFKTGLKDTFKCDGTIVNPAIGGTELRQNVVMMPRWLSSTPKPDLVTVCFGGNDWNSGMRGAMFTAALKDAIQRIRRATKGEADVLIMTTVPGVETWDTTAELTEAGRVAAKDEKAGLCDTGALFHELGKADKEHLFANDKVHLGQPGQQAIAKAVIEAIEKNGK